MPHRGPAGAGAGTRPGVIPPTTDEPPDENSETIAAWHALALAYGRLAHRLDEALQAEHGLPLTCHEVLRVIAASPTGRVSMSEVVQATELSAAGVTRTVGRLVREGLVVRERVGDDRRLLFARFTPGGREAFHAAEGTFLRTARDLLVTSLGGDLPVVQEALSRCWARSAPAPGVPRQG